jgi:hypothetical protein
MHKHINSFSPITPRDVVCPKSGFHPPDATDAMSS